MRFGASPQQASNNSFLNLLDAQLAYSVLPTLAPEGWVLPESPWASSSCPSGWRSASEELEAGDHPARSSTKLGLNRRDLGLIVRGDVLPQVDYGYNYRAPSSPTRSASSTGAGRTRPTTTARRTSSAAWFTDAVRLQLHPPPDHARRERVHRLAEHVPQGREEDSCPARASKRRFGGDIYYSHYPISVTYEFIYGQDDVTLGTTAEDPRKTRQTSLSHCGVAFFYNWGEQRKREEEEGGEREGRRERERERERERGGGGEREGGKERRRKKKKKKKKKKKREIFSWTRGLPQPGRYDDWWPKAYQPFLRVDLFDPSTEVQENRVDVYTLGFNVFFAEATKFQLNVNRRDDRTSTEGPNTRS